MLGDVGIDVSGLAGYHIRRTVVTLIIHLGMSVFLFMVITTNQSIILFIRQGYRSFSKESCRDIKTTKKSNDNYSRITDDILDSLLQGMIRRRCLRMRIS